MLHPGSKYFKLLILSAGNFFFLCWPVETPHGKQWLTTRSQLISWLVSQSVSFGHSAKLMNQSASALARVPNWWANHWSASALATVPDWWANHWSALALATVLNWWANQRSALATVPNWWAKQWFALATVLNWWANQWLALATMPNWKPISGQLWPQYQTDKQSVVGFGHNVETFAQHDLLSALIKYIYKKP